MPKQTGTQDLTEYPLADATRKGYLNHLERLDKWLKGREITDETLAEYVGYLFDRGKSSGSAVVTLAAARWRCISQDIPDPRGRLCRAATLNFKRKGIGRGRGQVDGLSWEQASLLASLAAQERTIYGYRDAAWIAVMSDALLRVSEAVAADVEHIDFAASTLDIPRSKTDQTGKGATLYLGPETLEHVQTWLEKAKVASGPLFRPIHRDYEYALKRRLNDCTIRDIIKARCKQAGFKGRFSGHSFRVGSAQSLAQRGASIIDMQRVGRWLSPELPGRYARKHEASQSAVARLRYGI